MIYIEATLVAQIFASLIVLQGTALKLVKVNVPAYKIRGESALLECDYELERDSLYSLKWYKDNEEFYRYVPKANPASHSYKIEGIKVDHQHSDSHQVTLKMVNLRSSGLYRCEVSAEAPSFASAQGEGRMEVVYLPKDNPQIIPHEERQYQVGDELSLNCTSGKSYPASTLQWYINDRLVTSPEVLRRHSNSIHQHGLWTSSLGLSLVLTSNHFNNGHMKLRCVASVSPVLWQGDRESVVERIAPLIDNREALLLVKGRSSKLGASLVLILLTSLLLS